MDPSELDQALEDLETRLERLRALYEQYFLGIEKIEPLVARKDVDRRIWVLRHEKIRNTARRFKMQTLIQRYNTFQQYWQRICREIENGTFKRHLLKAQRIAPEQMLTIAARKRLGKKKVSVPPEAEAGVPSAIESLTPESLPESMAATGVEPGHPPSKRTRAGAASSAKQPSAAPALATKEALAASAAGAAKPEAGVAPTKAKPAGVLGSLGRLGARREKPKAAETSAQQQGAASAGAPKIAEGAPAAAQPETRAASPANKPGIAPKAPLPRAPAVRDRPSTTGMRVAPDARPPPRTPAAPQPQASAVHAPQKAAERRSSPPSQRPERTEHAPPPSPEAKTGAEVRRSQRPRPPVSHAARAEAARPVTLRKSAPPAAARTAETQAVKPAAPKPERAEARTPESTLTKDKLAALAERLSRARSETHDSRSVSLETLEKSLKATEAKLRAQHRNRKIEFDVIIKDGKAVVKPIVR